MTADQRPTKYIVVQHGMLYAVDEMPPVLTQLSRIDIIRKAWEVEHVFSDTSHFRCAVDFPPVITGFQRVLAHTVYNPRTAVSLRWKRTGDYSVESLVSAVEHGLRTDDDTIQQWFQGGQVLQLLNAAQSWGEMLLAVEAVGGSHEVFPDVQR